MGSFRKTVQPFLVAISLSTASICLSQELVWYRSHDLTNPMDVTTDNEGNVITLGNLYGGPGVVKYDSDGNLLWSRFIGTASFFGVTTDSEGNIALVGGRAPEGIVLKLSADGDSLWQTDLQDILVLPRDITTDKDDNIITVGMSTSITAVKLSPEGEVLWSSTGGGLYGKACATDSEGNVIVSGMDLGADWDWLTIKFDPEGNKLWEAIEGGPYSDSPGAICVDVEDNIYVGGTWLVKYDKDGKQIWFDPEGLWGISSLEYDGYDHIYFSFGMMSFTDGIAKCDLNGKSVWRIPSVASPPARAPWLAVHGPEVIVIAGDTNTFNSTGFTSKYSIINTR